VNVFLEVLSVALAVQVDFDSFSLNQLHHGREVSPIEDFCEAQTRFFAPVVIVLCQFPDGKSFRFFTVVSATGDGRETGYTYPDSRRGYGRQS
jgi:hypothetical protein